MVAQGCGVIFAKSALLKENLHKKWQEVCRADLCQ